MTRTWDIFCSVVDNYGDIGVCWRLARHLSSELGQTVRLWIDDLASFNRICRAVDPARPSQRIGAVQVMHWGAVFPRVDAADIVIEGFGVRIPDAYVNAMAARHPRPVWINLEYLSAEHWVEGCHGLPSPHPSLPLVKHFFFPGFTSATGGLLMESGLADERDSFQNDAAALASWWRSHGVAPAGGEALRVSLFCYPNAALPALIEAWSRGSTPVICVVPEGDALAQLAQIVGRALGTGPGVKLGGLAIHAIPFLELDQYDKLLWACDINFVRGEDSFVRAQLAARPLVWQAYPQEQDAHLRKVAAFLERYAAALAPDARAAYGQFCDDWNRQTAEAGTLWTRVCARQEELVAHARGWARRLAAGGNLAVRLANFCENRLK